MRPNNMDHLTNQQLAGALNDIIEHHMAATYKEKNPPRPMPRRLMSYPL